MEQTHACHLCRIELDDLCVRQGGQTLLQNVSLHIHCGQLTALIGHNGAGKTTLLRALLGQVPYTGRIAHLDTEGRAMSRVRIGYVPQQLPFDRSMPLTVQDFLASALTRRPVWTGVSKRVQAQVREALALSEAEGLQRATLGKLSGGELQRVLLSLALTPAPDLLLLDEPVSGVDQNGQMLFLDRVLALRQERHMGILLISHDFSLVSQYADHVALLNKEILCQGAPEEVFASEAFAGQFAMPTHALFRRAVPAADANGAGCEKNASDGSCICGSVGETPRAEDKPCDEDEPRACTSVFSPYGCAGNLTYVKDELHSCADSTRAEDGNCARDCAKDEPRVCASAPTPDGRIENLTYVKDEPQACASASFPCADAPRAEGAAPADTARPHAKATEAAPASVAPAAMAPAAAPDPKEAE